MKRIKDAFITIGLLISLISFNCNPSFDCAKVKNGKFFYYAKTDGRKVYIERIDSLQVETDLKNNKVLKSKIVWQNGCTFKMFDNALSDTKLTKEDSVLATEAAIIEIVDVKSNFYICIAKFSTSKKDYEFRDTMYFQK